MDSVKQDFLNLTEYQIKRYQKLMEVVHTLPDGLPGRLWGDYELNLTIPFDPALFAAVRRMLGNDWRFKSKLYGDNSGTVYRRYEHKNTPNVSLCIILSPLEVGATCRRVRVGERTEPVYQIVCE
jgi:hypothetical protein